MKTVNKIIGAILFVALNPLSAFSQTVSTDFENQETRNTELQISIVPYLGTNGKNSGITTNDFSFNLFGGYSAGTNKLEMASLFNINRLDAKYVQLAGIFNQVGGKVEGAQFAGIANANLDSIRGVQGAGIVNFTTGAVEGTQLAGITNFTSKSVRGFQGAGIVNFAGQELTGFQGAGIANFAGGNVKGTQAAGIVNFTPKDVQGVQVAGILNFARKVNGSQIGLFNYADSISGAPIGLLSIVKSGYHTLEIGTDEILPINLSFRTGTRSFYNMLFVGIRPEITDYTVWAFGYGIGTSPRLGRKTFLNIEASSQQLNRGNVEALNLINRFYVGADFQVARKVALFAGPSINFRVYDTSYNQHPDLFTYSGPKVFSERNYRFDDLASQFWWGFRAGIRFF
ncbi:hypothetical protein [Algoriphagus halophilus]|uniref:Uncharacterized protein n=1 Tax=Algoriphagus halophilus TaxID=226505 RepID=A0A1N6HU30_9BACT|nr:hypothetical protein [Algoriphagus halophilus]SIO23246.1 hypothetical protein SAMN05444394_3996 [Algoriphagus halophilus]